MFCGVHEEPDGGDSGGGTDVVPPVSSIGLDSIWNSLALFTSIVEFGPDPQVEHLFKQTRGQFCSIFHVHQNRSGKVI